MKFFVSILLFLFLIGLRVSNGYCSEIRLQSLGNCRLAIDDPDNQLNLYDWEGNPAYLVYDERVDWLRFYGGGNYYHTSLARTYDPHKEQNLTFNFEGLKQLKSNQTIRGGIGYNFNRKYQQAYAIERDPYYDDPLILTDTTSGNIFEDGPGIFVVYSYQPFQKVSFGIESAYQISTSLKKQYTRARTIHRNFETKVALVYHLSPGFFLGTSLNGSFLQDQIELRESWDEKSIYTIQYRSELVFRNKFGEFDRYINLDGLEYNLNLQHYSHDQKLQHLLSFRYIRNKQRAKDKIGSNQRKDSDWIQNGFELQYDFRLFINEFLIGLETKFSRTADWSEHPTLPILITERTRRRLEIGAGISRQVSTFLLVTEAGFSRAREDYNDYQSEIFRSGKHDFYYGKFGIEYQVDPVHIVRCGYSHDYFYPDYYSPRYLPEHNSDYLSLGFAQKQSKFEIDLHLDYRVKTTPDVQTRYDRWNVILYTQIFMN